MLDLILLNLKNFIFTASVCLSISSSEFYEYSSSLCCTLCIGLPFCVVGLHAFGLLLHTLLKWLSLLQLPQIFSYAINCLCMMFHSIYTLYILCCWLVVLNMLWSHLALCFDLLIISNSSVSFQLSVMIFCEHWTSIHFIQDKTCSFVILLVSFYDSKFIIISAVIISLLMPFMNCSFSLLSGFFCIYIMWLCPFVYASILQLIHLSASKVDSPAVIILSHYTMVWIYY